MLLRARTLAQRKEGPKTFPFLSLSKYPYPRVEVLAVYYCSGDGVFKYTEIQATALGKCSYPNATDYPIFTDHVSDMRHRSSTENKYQREFKFYISAKYNFETKIWTSGGFEIRENYWAKRDKNEPKYPILNDRLFLVRNYWTRYDHVRAVYCGDDLGEKEFKVRLNEAHVKQGPCRTLSLVRSMIPQ